ncbi:hypothetical protein ABNF97_17065 [Plantactinospora sp. B6F1]|uniref:hypothetical protein n=1 Tax=Plantactinospora sp. B6F1 TaxID=3158971 RepID=UPI0032D99EE8
MWRFPGVDGYSGRPGEGTVAHELAGGGELLATTADLTRLAQKVRGPGGGLLNRLR